MSCMPFGDNKESNKQKLWPYECLPGKAIVTYNESERWAHLMGAVLASVDIMLNDNDDDDILVEIPARI